MDSSNFFIFYFFLVGLVFIINFIILTVFGYIFLFILKKYSFNGEKIYPNSILEEIFISYAIGITIYMSLGFLLDLLSLFNFITGYLSIIVFDIFIIIYLYLDQKKHLKTFIDKNQIKIKLKNYFTKKNNLIFIGILVLTIAIIFVIQWIIIIESTSLIYTDPFKWYQSTFYLIDNQHTDWYNSDYNYPLGFTFYNAGILIVYPDYIFGYYFFKLVALYIISLYIIIASLIIRKLFKKNYLIILSFLLILSSRYFLSRTLLYISSSLASILLIIGIIIVINRYPDYLLGFIVVGLYFIHALTAFYFIFVLFGFFLYKFIINIGDIKFIIKQIYSLMLLFIIMIVLLIPYLIGIYMIYGDTFLDFLVYFFDRFEKTDYLFTFKNFFNSQGNLIKLIFPLDYFSLFIDKNFLDLIDELLSNSIYWFFVFPLIGLFIYYKPKDKDSNRELLIFMKIFIVVILIIFFIPYINPNIQFFVKFRKRILQSFNLPIIIASLFAIEWIVESSKRITQFLAKRIKTYNLLINKKNFYSKFLKIESLMILFLLLSTSSIFVIHRYPDYYYYYEDELVEVVLYLREHADPDSKILREELDSAVIFRILYDMKVKEWDLNKTSTYEDLLSEMDERGMDYLIFPKDFFDNKTVEDQLNDNSHYKDLVENDDYILFKVK